MCASLHGPATYSFTLQNWGTMLNHIKQECTNRQRILKDVSGEIKRTDLADLASTLCYDRELVMAVYLTLFLK